MPLPTPFHPRTAALCRSLRWKDWSGYYAVCAYGDSHLPEYFALRTAAALLDVTPLFKYRVQGPDAAAFLSRVMTRDLRQLKPGRVVYCTWCDDAGKLLDDGTAMRFAEDRFRVTAADPSLAWLQRHAGRFRVQVEEETDQVAALAVQGPSSRRVLERVCDAPFQELRYFGLAPARLDGVEVTVTRTGYTGDLGYELWCRNQDALRVWDAVLAAGRDFNLQPMGLDALDLSRVEAGFVLNGVDYFSAQRCLLESQKSTPYELDLGWTVQLEREPFLGQAALRAEAARGPRLAFVGLEIDWEEIERLYESFGLPPELPGAAWRDGRPVYSRGRQVGRATSGVWSPTLKKNLALATVEAEFASPGTTVQIETTVEYQRRTVSATVRKKPFFDPERKRGL